MASYFVEDREFKSLAEIGATYHIPESKIRYRYRQGLRGDQLVANDTDDIKIQKTAWFVSGRLNQKEYLKELAGTAVRIPIDELDLSRRAYNALRRAHIEYIDELQNIPTQELFNIKWLGGVGVNEIVEKLSKFIEKRGEENPDR